MDRITCLESKLNAKIELMNILNNYVSKNKSKSPSSNLKESNSNMQIDNEPMINVINEPLNSNNNLHQINSDFDNNEIELQEQIDSGMNVLKNILDSTPELIEMRVEPFDIIKCEEYEVVDVRNVNPESNLNGQC